MATLIDKDYITTTTSSNNYITTNRTYDNTTLNNWITTAPPSIIPYDQSNIIYNGFDYEIIIQNEIQK